MDNPIRIIVADDHPVVLFALDQALAPYPNIRTVGHAHDSSALIMLLDQLPCDVLVTDFSMPGGQYGDGIAMLKFLRTRYARLAITVLTMVQNPALIRNALGLGISGFISKGDDIAHVGAAIVNAAAAQRYIGPNVQAVLEEARERGPTHVINARLTRREVEVLRLYLTGERISAIAASLNRSVKTVSAQKSTAMRKLGTANDADLFEYAQVHGLYDPFEDRYDAVQCGGRLIGGT